MRLVSRRLVVGLQGSACSASCLEACPDSSDSPPMLVSPGERADGMRRYHVVKPVNRWAIQPCDLFGKAARSEGIQVVGRKGARAAGEKGKGGEGTPVRGGAKGEEDAERCFGA